MKKKVRVDFQAVSPEERKRLRRELLGRRRGSGEPKKSKSPWRDPYRASGKGHSGGITD